MATGPKTSPERSRRIKVSLFVTCLVDQLFPEVGVSVVRLLRRVGVEVDFPRDQTCCGQAVLNSGFSKEARLLARRVLKTFKPPGEGVDNFYVVVPSGSCASMLRIFYPHLFQHDPELHRQAEELSGRVYELSEFLVKVLGVTDVGASFQGEAHPESSRRVTYHPSCHLLRELGVSQEPRTLLSNVRGADLVDMEQAETCCGFGGTFSVKYPHISVGMLEDKVSNIVRTGAGTLVACDMSCLMHISGALSRRGIDVKAMHLAQFLDS